MEKLNINSLVAQIKNMSVAEDKRDNLVAAGKLLVLEAGARKSNQLRKESGRPTVEYAYAANSIGEFGDMAAKWQDDVLYYCAKRVNDFAGRQTDRNNRKSFTDISLALNPMFVNLLSGIISEVMYTVTPTLVNDLAGEMASVSTVGKGKTLEVAITSNAVFQWYDSSWTALRSVPQHELWNGSITVNPKPKATRFRVNWYQMVGNGTGMVDTLAAVAGGYAALMMQKFTTAFLAAADNTRYLPAAFRATSYTDANWVGLTQNVAAANRVGRDQLVGLGDYAALRKIIPQDATLAPAIMTLLGEEYFKNGYIAIHDKVRLYEIDRTVTPSTINTTMQSVFPTDTIIIAARANRAYAPMVMAFEEDADMRLDLTPGDATLATGYLEGMAVASYDIAPAFASRLAVMTGVS